MSRPIPYPHPPRRAAGRRPRAPRRGISLLEVLIATFILMVGMLGVAAVLPVGRLALVETGRSDRCGACGRAALREIEIARMLDYRSWSPAPAADPLSVAELPPFVVDPLGYAQPEPLPGIVGQVPQLLRRGLSTLATPQAVEHIFLWRDDLVFEAATGARTRPKLDDSTGLVAEGAYSWFFTVSPATSEAFLPIAAKRQFQVSVVVCHRRNLAKVDDDNNPATPPAATQPAAGERTFDAALLGMGYGGGGVQLTVPAPPSPQPQPSDPPLRIREGQWVMLVGRDAAAVPRMLQWYRVVSGDTKSAAQLTNGEKPTIMLDGPDWPNGAFATVKCIVIDGAAAVYTSTLEIDNDVLWTP